MSTKNKTKGLSTATISELPEHLGLIATMPTEYPPSVVLMGDPGIGKTAGVSAYCKANALALVTRTATEISDPSELAGMSVPLESANSMRRMLPEVVAACWSAHLGGDIRKLYASGNTDVSDYLDAMLAYPGDPQERAAMATDFATSTLGQAATTRVVLFFDEITKAPPTIQGFCLTLMNEHQVSGFALPPHTQVILAGNGTEDGSACYSLPSTILNRGFIFDMLPCLDGWLKHERAQAHGLNDMVESYLNKTPEALNRGWSPDTPHSPFATPRSWSRLNALVHAFAARTRMSPLPPPPDVLTAAIIGDAEATRFRAHWIEHQSILAAATILANPTTVPLPSTSALVSRQMDVLAAGVTTHAELQAAIAYASRAKSQAALAGMLHAVHKSQAGRVLVPDPVSILRTLAQGTASTAAPLAAMSPQAAAAHVRAAVTSASARPK